jgi:hypothetical protein
MRLPAYVDKVWREVLLGIVAQMERKLTLVLAGIDERGISTRCHG